MKELAIVVPAYNERGITGTLQGLYNQTPRQDVMHYVVDNGSTDNTRELIESFAVQHQDFPLTILDEPQKGTGAASDTGFRRAIDEGYQLIARTDADTVPRTDWTARITNNFNSRKQLQLLGGYSVPLKDAHYRIGDELLIPAAFVLATALKGIRDKDPRHFKTVVGHNLATRSTAYTSTGGFPRSSIEEIDEDGVYSFRVMDKFGSDAVDRDYKMQVATSMRRARQFSIRRGLQFYLLPRAGVNHSFEVDVR